MDDNRTRQAMARPSRYQTFRSWFLGFMTRFGCFFEAMDYVLKLGLPTEHLACLTEL
jgi:hypothetical protein